MAERPGTPKLIGPINTWFDALVLEGCLPTAEVVVQTDHVPPNIVAKGMAGGGRDTIPLLPGVSLVAGKRLRAFQKLGGSSSPLTPDLLTVVVDAAPTSHDQ